MTWKKIYKGIADSVPTYLTVAIDADDTSITVADATAINTGETEGYIILGSGPTEVLKFTAQPTGNTYTVVRGTDGRTPQSWPIGTVVSRRYTSKDQQDIIDIATELQGAVDTINGATFKAADADKLDGNDSTYYSVSTHNHDLAYLGITAKAADSDLLDSHDISYFEPAISTLPISKGGTGITTAPANGKLLIGKTDGSYASATITAGNNVTVTNADGAITIAASLSGGSGTGDVVGPATATDNALARFDNTTGKLIQNSVATLSDAGVLNLPTGGGVTVNGVAIGGGSGGDASTLQTHPASDFALTSSLGTSAAKNIPTTGDASNTEVVYGTDTRLTNARAPTTHASTHKTGGADAVKLDELAAPTDITALNATTAAHGLCPKGDAVATHYLRGDLTWGTPVGGTGAVLDEYGRLPQAEIGTQIGAVDPTTTDGDLIYRKKATVSTYVIGGIGDSIMVGSNITAGHDPLSQAAAALSTVDITISASNQAIAGTSTAAWTPSGTNYLAAMSAFSSAGVRAVVVMLGTNDAGNGGAISAADYYTYFHAMVTDLVGRGYLVFLAYPPYTSDSTRSLAHLQAYQTQLNRLANNQTIFIVGRQDYAFFAANPSLLQVDGVHPTDAGSVLLGSHLWAPEIAPIIAQRTGITTLQRLTLGTGLSITNGVINASGGGSGATRLDPIPKSVAIATTDAATGKTDSVDLTCSYGQISRIRVRSDWTAGQQSGPGTFQVNNASGITAAATTIAIDTGSAGFTLAAGDEVWIDNECVLCGASTSATSIANATRGYAGTVATIHQDNVVGYKANDGLTLDLYPSSARIPAERLLRLSGIMTESLTTNAAIGAGDHVVKFTASPVAVSDVGRGSLFRLIDTTSDLVRVQDAYGSVLESGISTFSNSITTYDSLTAHDTAKNVQRVIEYDLAVPFKFATGTTLYLTLTPAEKISATVNATIEFIVDQFGA